MAERQNWQISQHLGAFVQQYDPNGTSGQLLNGQIGEFSVILLLKYPSKVFQYNLSFVNGHFETVYFSVYHLISLSSFSVKNHCYKESVTAQSGR